MKVLKVKKLREDAILPQRAHSTDSGLDLFAAEDEVLWYGDHKLIKTGIAIELEPGYEAQVRSKSGIALKQGVFVLNSPGTVDCGYQGEKLIKTGIAIELEPGYEAQVRSKSGIALKQGVFVLNSPGTVDCGYQGEIGVILFNTSRTEVVKIKKGQKIAQLVVQKVELPEVVEVDEIYSENSDRGDGGFGSTGLTDNDCIG